MGLTSTSTGNFLIYENPNYFKKNYACTVALVGNPNVRKIYYF